MADSSQARKRSNRRNGAMAMEKAYSKKIYSQVVTSINAHH
jgi:hypothetical protein